MNGPSTSTPQKKTRPHSEPRARLLDGLPVTERRLQVSDVSTAVLEGGEGPPLVLLHGPGESSLWWMRVIPDLVSTHRVIVPDLPGHGASAAGEHVLEEEGIIEWTDQLIDRTCPSEPTSLIWGRHDFTVPLKKAEAAGDRYGWPLYVIEEARDDPKFERPEAFLRVLYGILRDSG